MFRLKKLPVVAVLVTLAFACLMLNPVKSRLRKSGTREVQGAAMGVFTQAQLPGTGKTPFRNTRAAWTPKERRPPTSDEQLASTLDDIREQARKAEAKLRQNRGAGPELDALRADRAQLQSLAPQAAASFRATADQFLAAGVPDVIRARQVDAEAAFTARLSELEALLARAQDEEGLRKLAAFFDAHRQGALEQAHVNPKRLPFRAAVAATRAPITSARDLAKALVAPAGATDANLAETPDVQLTPAVRQLAAQLGNDPVRIFSWVRNHVEWLPTYGSVQGSEFTLTTLRGNAFDTSSLLIALLRAAGIQARYVYGTIDVPAAQAMNWVGNVTRPEAAQQLLGQGGIPNVAVTGPSGISVIRLEHVWVEAFVDFAPSRGAVNRTPDSWVALDPSFKQYEYGPPADARSKVPSNLGAIAQKLAASARIDPQTGSVTGLDMLAFGGWEDDLLEGLDYAYGDAPDLSTFVGGKKTILEESSMLEGGLPTKVVTRAATYAALPSTLRHRISMSIYSGDPIDRALGGTLFDVSVDLPAVSGKRLGVTWVPATAADATTLQTYKDAGAKSLPVYLIQVVPVVRIDDTEIARGPSITMGSAQDWDVGLVAPNDPNVDVHTYKVSAGDEMVWGLDPQGLSQTAIHARFQQRPSDSAAENLHTVAMYYWAQCDVMGQAVGVNQNVVIQRLPSLGLFSAPLQVSYFFGIPRSGTYRSRQMDVAHSIFAQVGRANGSTLEFMRLDGYIGSLLEGRTFDGLLQRAPGQGVSAVQLLREANEQGIPLHEITSANWGAIAPLLHVTSSVMGAIDDAVGAGKRVLVSERPALHGNWSGVGYIIEDPETGAGAYMIEGGLSGGADDPCNPEEQPDPVHITLVEFIIIVLLIVLIILLLMLVPELIVAIGEILGELSPAFARVLAMLGIAATGAPPAYAAGGPGGPGAGILPPGDCDQATYDAMKAAVDGYCKSGPSCKTTDCPTMVAAQARLANCAAARQAIMVACFRGGDQAHIDALDAANRALANCTCRVARLCP